MWSFMSLEIDGAVLFPPLVWFPGATMNELHMLFNVNILSSDQTAATQHI